jgi:hypothetical protein
LDLTPEKRTARFSIDDAFLTAAAVGAGNTLTEFAVGATYPVTMQFAHYVTPVNAGDQPLYTEPFTMTFRKQTQAELCDKSTLSTTTTTPSQEYKVTKDFANIPFPTITKTDAVSALSDCVVTQKL